MIFFQGGSGNPFQAFIDAINLLVAGGGIGGSGLATPPSDPAYYGLLFTILVFALFEQRKVFFVLYLMLSFLMFGVNGIAVALLFWTIFSLTQLAWDFFR